MTTKQKLESLRRLIKKYGFSAYIIPSSDPNMSYDIPARYRAIEWLTGFTGSAGILVVTGNFAGLWTDPRYFIQAEKQLHGTGVELMKLNDPRRPAYIDWFAGNTPKGGIVGFDGNVVSARLAKMIREALGEKDIAIDYSKDLIDLIWKDRPALPPDAVFEYGEKFSGKSRKNKLDEVMKELREEEIDFNLLTSADDIAWLFNLRGSDMQHSPLFVAYAIISRFNALLFADELKIPGGVKASLMKDGVSIYNPSEIEKHLNRLPKGRRVLLTPAKTNIYLYDIISSHCRIVDGRSIPALMKTSKNETEISHLRNVMIKEGVALVRFFIWLERSCPKRSITEYTAARQLEMIRSREDTYTGNSFSPIVAYGANAAQAHYTPGEETAAELRGGGLLLVDSGAQYLDGTTDTTRTVSLGTPTRQQKRDFTLVLKGHIEIATTVFPEGTRGFHLDAFARKHMWRYGINYGHGTGHGVGFFLNVHEGPPSISPNSANDTSLQPGMVLSNEPGIYREDQHGIRTENLVLVKKHSESRWGVFLTFETLTLFPVEFSLIESSMLSPFEKEWLNNYHSRVYEKLSPFLNLKEKEWLKNKTAKIQ